MSHYKNLYTVILVFMLLGCSEDFTDLAPVSQRNVENFFQTATDMEVAVNGIYNALQLEGTYNQSYWVMQEMRSDNTDQGNDVTGLAREMTVIEEFQEISTSNIVEAAWVDSYVGIGRANVALNRIEAVAMDQALKDRLTGEALFLRSLFYYHLVVSFGNIPLILTETQELDEGQDHEQVSATAVYNQLASDLALAEQLLGLPADTRGLGLGRANKGAAATLLAKVHLILGNNAEAETVLRRIIDNYGYQLLPSYGDLWGEENEHNPESIFEIEFIGGGLGRGNQFTNAFTPTTPTNGAIGVWRNRPTREMFEAYETGDLRKFASIDTSYFTVNGGDTTFFTNTENDVRFTTKFGTENPFVEGDAPNNFTVFRYADVLLMLAEATGESDEAYTLINQVRNRAGLANIDASTPGTFQEKLLHERRVELAYENHRWADLLRFGAAEQTMVAIGKNPRLLFLVPQREIDLNDNLDQNQ